MAVASCCYGPVIIRILTLCGWMLVSSGVGLANGGGYSKGGMEWSGDIEGFLPKQTEKVQILDEQLTITLGPKSAEVEVRYLMKNISDSKAKVRFGFPVEVSKDVSMFHYSEDAPKPKSNEQLVDEYCSGYQVTAFGKPLKAEFELEKRQKEDERFDGIAGWLVSEFKLDPGIEMPMRIKFVSRYPYFYSSVSEDESSGYGSFKYRLSTAACWAGPLAKGRVVIKSQGIRASEVSIIKPVNRFRKVEDAWVLDFENLEPTLADDIEVNPGVAESEYWRAINKEHGSYKNAKYVERGERWFIDHAAYEVKASSTLPTDDKYSYEATKLKEQGLWSEGAKGNGMGEWLELKPQTAKPLDQIIIRPGCWLSPDLHQANARPKKIKVELNGEKEFEVDVPDEMEERRIYVEGYNKPVSKIRLTFMEVWPGTKYDDLCMSGIRLRACIEKKPHIQPAR